ncbi:alcohol dehydrogenase [Variovorax sp. WS11]|uniref:acrylyl-CoA reductase (NADPH) n=1 Tax=Variovorax sp. WS11 TaxID=1105204 RepID=UPI000D0DFD9B|nr:MDR family oxidoreductase [Variovorax sp. WS11]NDZ13306.1 oxidoreductase [Variovorax sp. WS11]PSL79348.1 alcohol dehydrogenase [Variovorax sp. WS11]
MFKAIVLQRHGSEFDASVRELDDAELPDFDVRLRVEYSSLNYKDALAIADRAPVVRRWPMVPGIDGAGVVEHSSHPHVKAGDRVILNGWGAGETHWGCLAGRAALKGEWLVPLPASLDARTAMAIGTAGYTAMLCVQALQRAGVRPDDGEILVTGAAGGVGNVAISLLAGRGFRVVASTGRASEADYLKRIGAAEVIDRATLSAPGKPLGKERWAGVVDSVGSHTLVNACATTRYGGVVTACGLAQGMDLPGSVAPFILRGVTLIGIDSVMAPREARLAAWQQLAEELERERVEAISREVTLDEAIGLAPALLAGQVRGRTVVRVEG